VTNSAIGNITRRQGPTSFKRHLFCTLKACGVHGIDCKGVSLDFTGFSELHPSCLLDLKR